MHRLIIEGKEYELPVKTIDIMQKIEAISKLDMQLAAGEIDVQEAMLAEYAFVAGILGQELTDNLMGTGDIECADMDTLLELALSIIQAYSAEATKLRLRTMLEPTREILADPDIKSAIDLLKLQKND